jgi:hypothetical protein
MGHADLLGVLISGLTIAVAGQALMFGGLIVFDTKVSSRGRLVLPHIAP